MAASLLIVQRTAFQQALQAWYAAHHRKLPWREASSLYKTVVSEFMLQQTQVATVLPYFERWLQAMPDFRTLAAASETEILKLWEGLGYYSRARNLYKLAKIVVALNTEPRTPEVWRELPGVGPYTAAAVTSVSFGHPVACVDGNVIRILARLTGEGRQFRDSAEAAKFFTPLAELLITNANPGFHNQAMMELGATICMRQNPRCLLCPVAEFCVGKRDDTPTKFPRLAPKKWEQRETARLWVEDGYKLLLYRARASAKRLAGLHELPAASLLGMHPKETELIIRKQRRITRFQISEPIYRIKPNATLRRKITESDELVWAARSELGSLTLSGPHRRWIRELLSIRR